MRARGPTAQDDATTPASPAVAVSARGGHVSERDKNNLRQAGQESPPVLAKSLLRTALACIRLDKDQRRNAVHKWYGESGLDGSNNTDNKARDALAKAVVVELALKLRLPLKLSRFRLVARVVVILVISQVDLVTDLLMLVQYSHDGRAWAFAASACFL
eukprot:CAMPEP_0119475442 /NCGR_PEP_ID=MMETSP1344-20130328/6334_1 /TAXON_ID=236787 /ORGANISM="Florenciella parvula, Strain CCMP2471" /LENGTH=158 /DNA_ID=CAMNT_0007508973 /DNA_START=160 /DNA_END=633 /DNA_ORIENTATION=-